MYDFFFLTVNSSSELVAFFSIIIYISISIQMNATATSGLPWLSSTLRLTRLPRATLHTDRQQGPHEVSTTVLTAVRSYCL